ncbi:methionyl-tRNA formyltransferase [Gloeobacter kilaueensis]|uniref:Methionyl-tRNA formyltransferase n=1 Tax=Gloeobacter kilaueensis (strain ATCC BAA-2537 / CCAP 1431/1 / ULC 316 / JS1) TaxID=1183438 RepID=U5QNF9_GLOK1|nr:methionyl-tRNA formyltransferase [Gloeobacter kilaueensis]AGY59139.1 methionyl-tRNA formyltransferase [Gloeobacter kilaueensis JS1]
MRVVFFGTAEFAVPSLERLLAQPDIEVAAVVTQPDRPQGRGNRLSAPPVKQLAQKRGLTVFQPERLRKSEEVLAALESQQADFFVVAAYGQILPQRVLDLPGRAPINVHGSLLPKYRGAAPVQWAIYRGESESGVTIMRMEAGLDTGPMLKKAVVAIEPEETAEALLARLAQIGADLLIQTLREFDRLIPEVQDDSQSSYAPLIDKQLYRIDWQQAAPQIRNQIRAFYPYAHTFHWKERLRILESRLTHNGSKELLPGTIINIIKGQGLEVQTGDGALLITKVQPAGKKAQSAWDYANGSRTQAGDCLGLPDSPPD